MLDCRYYTCWSWHCKERPIAENHSRRYNKVDPFFGIALTILRPIILIATNDIIQTMPFPGKLETNIVVPQAISTMIYRKEHLV